MTPQQAPVLRHVRFHTGRRVALANEATRRGIRVVLLGTPGVHIAVEPHQPAGYTVTVDACTCKRWRAWHCCDHQALLQSELGYGASPEEIGWPGRMGAD
jgi:hypothetical protein